MAVSTFLTMVLVPVVYTYLARFTKAVHAGAKQEAVPAAAERPEREPGLEAAPVGP
jgi:hypothetical protein